MPTFQYKVKRGADEVKTGVLDAESRSAAVAQLRGMGYFPISVEESTGKVKPAPEIMEKTEKKAAKQKADRSNGATREKVTAPSASFGRRRVRLKDRNWFFRQLANLLLAG